MKSDSTCDIPILDNVSKDIHDLLEDIGAPCHLSGYDMVRYSLNLAMNDSSCLNNLSKNLYPKLSEMFNKSENNVERCIRNFIEYIFYHTDYYILNKYFGSQVKVGKAKVTNTQFLYILYRVLSGSKTVR